jgi:hypothetical protein
MSGAKKAICVAMLLAAVGPLAMSEDLGFTVGLDVGFGDVLSAVAVELTPYVKWAGSLSVLDVTLYADYDNTIGAGSAGSSTMYEVVSYSIGEDTSIALSLKNKNTISFDAPISVSGSLRPSVDLTAGMFYGTLAFPIAYTPAPVGVSAYAVAGLAGDNWDADVTVDFTLVSPFSWDDVVLYLDYTVSIATISCSATLPSSFDMVTLSPWVDLSLLDGALTVGGGVDLDIPFSAAGAFALTPYVSVSYSF